MDPQVSNLDQGSTARWIGYLILIFVYLGVGYGVSRSTNMSKVFDKHPMPAFAPPKVTFAVVWPILYVLSGYSVCRVAQRATTSMSSADWGRPSSWPVWIALLMAALHLGLSNTWTYFFAKEQFRNACYVLLGLLGTVALQLYASSQVDKVAGFVLVPLLVWLGYALLMNASMADQTVN